MQRHAVAFAVLLAACSGDESTSPSAAGITAVELSQRSLTLGVGSTAALEARVLDADGNAVSIGAVFWSSSAPEVARVSASGVITAITEGRATIAATVQGRSAVALLTVAPTAAAAVRLSLSDVRLTVGQQSDLNATVLDASGAPLSGRVVNWRTSNASIAVVDSTGHITAIAPGAASITATSEARSATAAVTVSAIAVASVHLLPVTAALVEGQTTQLAAEPRDAAGRALAGRSVTWTSSASSVATVSSTGQVVANAPGTATITASAEGRTATAAITVTRRPVSSLVASPSQLAMTPGQTARITVVITDANGNPLSGRTVSFSSASSGIAQVSNDGLVTAVAAGTSTVTVTSEGKTASVPVNVSPTPTAAIRVSPANVPLIVGDGVTLEATVLDAANNPLDRSVSWSSGAPTVASVSASGRVSAISVGTAVILASADGRFGSTTVTVRAVPVATVAIAPATVTLDPNATTALSATLRSATGATLSDRTVFWTTSDPKVATVSAQGVVTAIAAGTATITSSAEGQSGTAAVVVNKPATAPVARLVVSPALASIRWTGPNNRAVQLTATAYTSAIGGTKIPNAEFTWTSNKPDVATVSPTGLVTAISDGTAIVTARSGNATSTATIFSQKR